MGDIVQTPRDGRSGAEQWWHSWPVPFIAWAAKGRVRVAAQGSARSAELAANGYSAHASRGTVEPRACRCGCGLPCPVGQAYADTDVCRKNNFALFHPTLDLTGLTPEWARRAVRMCQEAIRAAKLGQARATVAADSPVTHAAEVRPDRRPSNRIRLDPETWRLLEEIREAWGMDSATAAARWAIAKEHAGARAMERRAKEPDADRADLSPSRRLREGGAA